MKWMVAALLAIVTPSLFGQTEPTPAALDSVVSPEPIIPSGMTAARVDTVTKYHPTKSAGLAMLFSALVPGAGQLYNESYWKIPVVVGFGVWFGSQWLHYNRLYRDYRDQYTASITGQFPGGNGRLLDLREFYRDQRDTFTWYIAILYFLNVADAYVDASLYDFNVGDDLSIRLMPEAGTRLALRVSF
jgi:hypothetical protein